MSTSAPELSVPGTVHAQEAIDEEVKPRPPKEPPTPLQVEGNHTITVFQSLLEKQTEELCYRFETILMAHKAIPYSPSEGEASSVDLVKVDGRHSRVPDPPLMFGPRSSSRLDLPHSMPTCERDHGGLRDMADPNHFEKRSSKIKPGRSIDRLGDVHKSTRTSDYSVSMETITAAITEHRKQKTLRHRLTRFIHNSCRGAAWKQELLDVLVVFVILSNAVILFVQTHLDDAELHDGVGSEVDESEEAHLVFLVIEHFFNIFFIVEILMKFYLERWKYLHNVFAIFDILLVLATSIDMYVLEPYSLKPGGSNVGVSHLARIFRVVRILRVVRVVRFAKQLGELKLIVNVLDGCLSTLIWAMLIIGVITFGSGIFVSELLSTYIADGDQPLESRELIFYYYGNAARASYTLFEAVFSGMWPTFSRPLVDINGWWAVFWVWFELVIGFAVLQTIGSIFFSEMIKASNVASDLHTMSKLKDTDSYMYQLKVFFDAADTSGDGCLSRDELDEILADATVLEYLRLMEIEAHEITALFALLDDREDGNVELDEFLGGAVRLKGNARSVDSILIMHEQNRMKNQIAEVQNILRPLHGRDL